MKRIEILFGAIRVPLDAAAVFGALLVAYRLREANVDLIPRVQLLAPAVTLPSIGAFLTDFVIPGTMLFLILAAFSGLYAITVTLGPWREIGRIIAVTAIWIAIVLGWFSLVTQQLFFSRILLLHSFLFIIFFVMLMRTLLVLFQRSLLKRGVGVRIVLSLGSMNIPEVLRRTLAKDPRYTYVGHVASLHGLINAQARHSVDIVLHTDPHPTSDDTVRLIDYCRSRHLGYAFIPPLFADVPQMLTVYHLGLVPILAFRPTPLDGWGRVWKRAFDIVASLFLLIVLSPILFLTGCIVLITSGWPVFYVSRRVGQQGARMIALLKFRTMERDADRKKEQIAHLSHRDGPLFKVHNDPRVTSCGAFLRRWTLDELPQLLNVFIGHMSLVGPRPHLPSEVNRYNDYQRRVFTVKPGMTGLAQISGRSNLRFDDEVRFDLRYIEEWSLFLDLWILWRTFIVVLRGEGAD